MRLPVESVERRCVTAHPLLALSSWLAAALATTCPTGTLCRERGVLFCVDATRARVLRRVEECHLYFLAGTATSCALGGGCALSSAAARCWGGSHRA